MAAGSPDSASGRPIDGPVDWPVDRPVGGGQQAQRPPPPPPPPRPTPLREVHEALGAALTGFAGWLMPLRYRSETAEHNAVRQAAGIFDLSHMGQIGVRGRQAAEALDYALVGNLSRLAVGRARYTMMCAADGGVLDDLIVYRLPRAGEAAEFLVVANAANAELVRGALADRFGGYDAEITSSPAAGDEAAGDAAGDATTGQGAAGGQALIAVQGPRAAAIVARVLACPAGGAGTAGDPPPLSELKYYASVSTRLTTGKTAGEAAVPVLLARTGYTGEDGFELFCRPGDAVSVWEALMAAGKADGLVPAGLAARDTLRLEAGMPLYGNELGRDVTPFEAGLGRVVRFDKPADFVGREALAARAGERPGRTLIGLAGQSRRVPRHGYPVLLDGQPCGMVTSGAPSPTLGRPIAMAYVDTGCADAITGLASGSSGATDGATGGTVRLAVDIRGRAEPASYVKLPFYQRTT